ncbi:insulin-like growth factor 2 mRNA-binding protein 1 isoform X3 [Homalodisca vitripennis]|uniref:RRM domain-containing protein n=2 Tax=Proconiini TaxID=565685 RepID=A0A1B6FSQ9_9HEMI|nr:insulin-like growth factor 2 mRNA-binding protein 1 isoform X3 [Homalodisca vitripennis]XP_046669692.1 insulin-like growth factor 2 mRNA-binding protein 1 isoform X3 [Homalodisca vitripennis]XP_046669693.1 insulin-like growth factor 2 mRNA-binding protein 1 isoform X3 [Homalodisca vitripennis]
MTSPSEIEDGSAPITPEEYNGFHTSSNTKIVVSNLPPHVRIEDLEHLLTPFGHVQKCEKLSSREGQPQVVQISYDTQEQAQQAVNELNGCQFEGSNLKVELAMERRGRGGPRPRGPPGGFPGMAGGGGRPTDFPLRILVQSDMVGAIIGRQGTTIRQITQQTRARVDVHRKDNVGSLEKAITIYGNPDNCTNACKKILEVMQQEATNTNKGEITLKILAHNNLIGRIIGKGGNTIKRIMQDTDTKITVSSINDINSFNLERIITVKGSIDNMSRAESMISAKLRQSYENDLQAMAPQSMMFPGLHPMAMMSTSGMGYSGRSGMGYQGGYPAPYPPMYQGGPPPIASAPPGGDASDPLYGGYEPPFLSDAEGYDPYCAIEETTYLYIPNNAVGAIIGTKGSHIRNMIRFSGASVKIAPMDENQKDSQQAERKVTIVGSPESQWKAQYLIFEKMREEGFVSGSDDVRLTVEILVPSGQVGRIIGKGGQNVRELQRVTGSIIKLPEQSASPPPQDEETTVHIIGPFFSVQSAQRRIRSMVVAAGGSGGRTPRGPRQETQ